MRTNINISNSEHSFKYVLEYTPTDIYVNPMDPKVGLQYTSDGDTINLYSQKYSNYIRVNNEWCVDKTEKTDLLQDKYKTAKLKIYFPTYSLETYEKNINYILTLNTWINGKIIYLGNYLFNRLDTCASTNIIKFEDENYYECIEFDIIDPWDVVYSDDWINFRKDICGEPVSLNNNGSCLNMSLYPVIKDINNNCYMMHDHFDGGQNAFNITKHITDNNYLSLNINENSNEEVYGINMQISFNEEYKNDLKLYLAETYNITNDNYQGIRYELIAKNNDNIILNPCRYDYPNSIDPLSPIPISHTFTYQDIQQSMNNISEWSWCEEYYFIGSISIYFHIISDKYYLGKVSEFNQDELNDKYKYYIVGENVYNVIHIDIISNNIPITQEIAKYLTFEEKNNISKINLDNMNIKQVNVVNEIVNNIIQIDKPKDSKSNIITPVFFKVRDAANIIIHPTVTENICINLDPYKNKVEKFVIQIEGIKFNEIGSTPQGIIFKVVGNMLPAEQNNGTYFILNENYEMITSGKYTYDK